MSSQASLGQSPSHDAHTHGSTLDNNGANEDGVTIRPMRLKVLYTFDDQNKTNCLARWPHVLQIQTIMMEEGTMIGVIELKTCIEAIIQCSPELVSRIGQDYTVYAYDFSEYDNPLVGQGMLSKVLRAVSPMPELPAQQSRQLITGRVCKNILGIFANGVKETLEVKLRLVPVPTALQNEYQSTMEKYRESTKAIPPPGFDSSEWTSFIQSNPNFSQMSDKAHASPTVNTPRDGQSLELVNQLLSPSVEQQTNLDSFSHIPRPGSSGSVGAKPSKSKKTNSRPSSRASVKRPRKSKAITANGGNTSGYEEGTDGDDGPAPKKRAKITKADANQKSSFGQTYESLRVAASTASSLRLFRPIAMSPAPSAVSHLQEVPRVPTPVPTLPNRQTPRPLLPQPGAQRRDSFMTRDGSLPRLSPHGADTIGPEDELRYSIESANPSPERNATPGDTPPDIASSPPVMRTQPPSRIPSSPPCPSSPVLPQMPRIDSGFMSGSLEDLFGECDDPIQAVETDEVEVTATRKRRRAPRRAPARAELVPGSFTIECPGPVELLPTRMPIIEAPRISKTAAARAARSRGGSMISEDGQNLPPLNKECRLPSGLNQLQEPGPSAPLPAAAPDQVSGFHAPQDAHAGGEVAGPQQPFTSDTQPSTSRSRVMVRTASMGSLTLPEASASDPVLPPSNLQRSQTWSEAPPPPMSEAMMPSIHPLSHMMQMQAPPMTNNNLNVSYSRTFNAKKAAIRNKLETAIMNGEMPPYCNNCGAIETPTWRKAWYQEHQGAPGYYDYSDEPGRVTAIVILSRDAQGNPTSYQLIKKYLLPEEKLDDFKELLLCNPCGIWMSKYKSQRPSDRWENHGPLERRGLPEKKRPQQRMAKPKKSQTTNIAVATSEANYPPSEAAFPPSEANFAQSELNFPQSDALFAQPGTECRYMDGISPGDTTEVLEQDQAQNIGTRRSISAAPTKDPDGTASDSTSAALRRAIEMSPARFQGSRHSPIDVEDDLGSTRRLLFPSPNKGGSPKILGETIANVVQISPEFGSSKQHGPQAQNKENCPPMIDTKDGDSDLLRLFKGELARPTTPTHDTPPSNPFKTPTRPTPSHRPVTRSVSKSAGKTSGGQMPKLPPSRTPCSAVRRSPRNHKGVFESPFTSTLNLLMSEANNRPHSPSRNDNSMHFDFENLPDLPVGGHQGELDQNFNFDDFFSTDVPMPSSPPRMFQLYEDSTAMNNINWSDFSAFDQNLGVEEQTQELVVKTESQESPKKASEGDDSGTNSLTKRTLN